MKKQALNEKFSKNCQTIDSYLRLFFTSSKMKIYENMKVFEKHKAEEYPSTFLAKAKLRMKNFSVYQKLSKKIKKFQNNPAKRLTYSRYVVQLIA